MPAHSLNSHKPLLYVDVDGVVSLLGFGSADPAPGVFHTIGGDVHCIPPEMGAHLATLGESFELVWATGWEHLANLYLPAVLDYAIGTLDTLDFAGRAVFGSAHWKVDAMTEHSGDRPVAWIDDNLDDTCRLWARWRSAPTLLVDTRSNVGLTREHVERLQEWARSEEVVAASGGRVSTDRTRVA